jgi:hypothetical protein
LKKKRKAAMAMAMAMTMAMAMAMAIQIKSSAAIDYFDVRLTDAIDNDLLYRCYSSCTPNCTRFQSVDSVLRLISVWVFWFPRQFMYTQPLAQPIIVRFAANHITLRC